MKKIVLLASLVFSALVAQAKDVVIDVRSPAEYAEGHVSGALNIEHGEIAKEISKFNIAKDDKIVLYCRSGRRSSIALESLKQLGYSRLENLGGLEEARQRLKPAAASEGPRN